MGAFTQSYAQSGASCSNSINLGNFIKDTTLTVSINYPDTVKWVQFTSNSNSIRLLAYSAANNNGKIKLKELNLYDGFCSPITNNITTVYPGQEAIGIKHITITPYVAYKIKLTRYYDVSLNDTPNVAIYLKYRGGSPAVCSEGSCGNLVLDGGFENHVSPLISGNDLDELECWSPPQLGADPKNFHTNYTPEWQIPNQFSFGVLGINLPTQNDEIYTSSFSNEGYIGVRTNNNSSDIVQGSLSTSLQANKLYFVTYLVSPGKAGYDSFHDRIDLDILDPTALYNYNPSFWGAGYSLHQPILESEDINFNQDWTRVSNVFDSDLGGQAIIYIGNLAKQAYSNTVGANPANSYYIDNLIVKPFELELGPDIVACEGQVVDLSLPCQYLYPGAEYTWNTLDPNFDTLTFSTIATGNYSYELTITVTNPQDSIETITDVISISIAPAPTIEITIGGGPQGTYCEVDGILYVVQGNQVSLTASGAGANGTYDWYVNGTLTQSNQSYFFTPGLAPVGDYQIVVIGTDSICSGSDTINLTIVSNICLLPCNTVLGQSAFVDGNNYLTNYTDGPHDFVSTSAASFNTLPLNGPNLTYVVDGTFTISTNTFLQFEEVTLLISPGGKIVNNGTFNLINCVVDGCEQMWDRIENRADFASAGTTFRHAEAAIELFENCTTRVDNSTFTDNIVGIYSRTTINNLPPKTLFYFRVSGSTFEGNPNGINQNLRFPIDFSQYTGNGSFPLIQPVYYLKPANGINIRSVAAINIGISTNNALPNHFINMWNGITFNNTTGIITNCRFEGMEANANHGQLSNNTLIIEPQDIILTGANPNYSTHYLDVNSNAIAIKGGSNVQINSLLNDNPLNPTIRNCFRGILCLSSSLRTVVAANPNLNGDMMFIRDVNTGLKCESNTQIHQLVVQQLDITACNLGIAINNQLAGSVSNVRFNNILMQSLPGVSPINMKAIQHRQIAGIGTNVAQNDLALVVNAQFPQVFLNINNNIINTEFSRYAIEIWGGTRTRILDNFINMEFSNNFRLGTGIDLVNCFGSLANCNFITSTGIQPNSQNIGNNDFSTAINLRSSENIGLSCNETERFWDGLSVNYPSDGGIFRGNTFRNEQSGLHYRTFANVGDQINNGNRWQNPFNNTLGAARADMPNLPDYSDDRYFTNPNSVFTPPSIVTSAFGATWFVPSNAATFDCQDAGFVCNWVNPDREGDTTNFVERLVDIAKEQNDNTEFGDEKLWMSKNYLIKELLKNDSVATVDSILASFLDSTKNTAAYKLQMLIHKMNVLQLGNSVLNAQLNLANEIYNLKLEEVYDAESNNDSILVQSLSVQLGQAFTNRELILNQINANRLAEKIVLEAELNALTTNIAIELNMKSMLLIYLNSCYINNLDNLSTSEAALTSMAYQCPMEFGDAVYWARTMLSMLHESLEFNDEAVCQAETNQRRANIEKLKQSTSINKNTLVYPNPANNHVFVLPKQEICQSISLRNQFGSIVWNSAQVNRFPYEINIENISSGMYILEIIFDNNKIENHKLTIFH
jgi:hypothetical protein